jgi:hypothetical protein
MSWSSLLSIKCHLDISERISGLVSALPSASWLKSVLPRSMTFRPAATLLLDSVTAATTDSAGARERAATTCRAVGVSRKFLLEFPPMFVV